MNLDRYQHIHLVGIGGVGMRAIATVLLAAGKQVSGSDRADDPAFADFRRQGAKIYLGHDSQHISPEVELIVTSTAIPKDNPEVLEAERRGIPVCHRSDIVMAFLNAKKGIAVAGAHGKTTTTSMLGQVFEHVQADASIIIGGSVNYLQGNAKLGQGDWVVAEADESDGSFLKLHPYIAVVTNIEDDHLDYYGSLENIKSAFIRFLNQVVEEGCAVLCRENENIRDILPFLKVPVITYGFTDADWIARDIRYENHCQCFEVDYHGRHVGTVTLRLPGKYNVLNALAGIAVGTTCGLTFSEIATGLQRFAGTARRFQTLYNAADKKIVDDYAHHPTEIAATLQAAKELQSGRVICAFQPHRYTRTDLLRHEFAQAFQAADIVVFTDIYPAGEKPIPGVTGDLLPNMVKKYQDHVHYVANRNDLVKTLDELAKPGDLVITMGAGDINECGNELAKQWEMQENVAVK